LWISLMYRRYMIAEDASPGSIRVAHSGTPRPATARLLRGPQATNWPVA